MTKEKLAERFYGIICGGRTCNACKLHNESIKYNLECRMVPLEFQMQYARELYKAKDEDLMENLFEINSYETLRNHYHVALILLESGNVQYV